MLAVLLVCLLLTMPAGLDAILEHVDQQHAHLGAQQGRASSTPMPYSFARKVRQVDGVAAAVAMTWFGGAFEEDGRVTFPNFAVEPEHVGAVYPDYRSRRSSSPTSSATATAPSSAARPCSKYGWKIGDRVTLRSTVWPAQSRLPHRRRDSERPAPLFWMNREYLDQALKAPGPAGPRASSASSGCASTIPKRVNAIMRDDRRHVAQQRRETACETEKSFFSNFFGSLQGFVTIILIVTGLVALCIVFIAANTASMGVRERAGEIAVLQGHRLRPPRHLRDAARRSRCCCSQRRRHDRASLLAVSA